MPTVLEVSDLVTRFHTPEGVVHAVNGVSFVLNEGETLAIVGESGSGKSVSMLSLLQLIPIPPGKITNGTADFLGEDLLRMSKDEIRHVRGARIGMIFQDPMTSLNPVLTIGRQLTEPLEVHMGMDKHQARVRAIELLRLVGIPNAEARVDGYPHQFSGGMRQRAMIAVALSCQPSLLIADEPTTALDVTIQAQILSLMRSLRQQFGMAIMFITHNLGVIAQIADNVAIMYLGKVVEYGPVREILNNPKHPYTVNLLQAVPRLGKTAGQHLVAIEGSIPGPFTQLAGCPFHPRCSEFMAGRCDTQVPARTQINDTHTVRCFLYEP